MRVLIFGAGNLLLSDEGFGVHVIRYLGENYRFGDDVELYDGGTLGFMASHKLEEAQVVYLIDVVTTPGEPGTVYRFEKDDFIGRTIPVKMSPHQLGIQEMLLLSDIRGRCPDQVSLLGIVPKSYEAGVELSPELAIRLPELAELLRKELTEAGVRMEPKAEK
ncbi:HyaD/HybD family hydrogenase maturation endopeptidase [Trichlorobacter ammonificans]|uniref:Hydrogenase maturation protease n=1 Tax=Trichlorobacter ammonificans TaxID=2916410 RepID=A0ABM9DBG3_9BACT|nr:HyaD/HybD family hydrogenase maturation endopeptidase [Trichlorobacter ammonificans]CAH2032578.1 Hydrogenase maturation protease [Trichlorobacter ammonificans]